MSRVSKLPVTRTDYFLKLLRLSGDVVHFSGFGTHVIILNALKPIIELLDVRGSNYSHRPNYLVAGQLGTVNQSTPLMSYGEQWRLHRRLSKPALNVTAVKKYWGLEQQCAALMCKALLESPDDFFEHVRMCAAPSCLVECHL